MGRRGRLVAAAAGLALLGAEPALAQGCAMCRRNLEANGGAGLLQGFYWSILLLVGTPMVLVGTFLLLLYRARRQAMRMRAGREEGGSVVAATGLEPVT